MGTSGGSISTPPAVAAIRLAGPVLPLMILGAQTDITVTWTSPMPSDVYSTGLDATALIGKGTAVVTAQTSAGLTIHVTAAVLIAAGLQILCAGWSS